ncbi:MAG: hypothetical protein KC776_04835 [Myxococcales bacterium]|nr:hypothetical protein [Myxococcales bacterium]MCB9578815.1 hypothetical protein [Polyangiaceae bacterium]
MPLSVALGRSALPIVVWLGFAAWMLVDWRSDPYDPTLTGTRAYGHNGDGSLWWLAVSLVELAVLMAVTCPFLRQRPRWFFVLPMVALLPFAGWFVLNAMGSMHGGGVTFVHLFWLLALGALLVLETILSGVSALSGRAGSRGARVEGQSVE